MVKRALYRALFLFLDLAIAKSFRLVHFSGVHRNVAVKQK